MSVASLGLDELETLVASNTVSGTLARGLLAGLGAVAASDIINAFTHSSPQTKAKHSAQHYAIVDLANNRVVTFLSRKRVYRLLSAPKRGKSRGRRDTIHVITPDSTNPAGGVTVLRS